MGFRKQGSGQVVQDEESLAKESKRDWSAEDEAELRKEDEED